MSTTELGFEGRNVGAPAISEDATAWACQVVGSSYVAGVGHAFRYCEYPQRFVATWTLPTRMRERRQLRVCEHHGRAFAARHGLAAGSDSQGGRGARETVRMPIAEGPIAARKTVVESPREMPISEDPFGDDAEQPFGRVREASR